MTDQKMCPCGCGDTYREAVNELMNSASAMNRDQAEAHLSSLGEGKVQ